MSLHLALSRFDDLKTRHIAQRWSVLAEQRLSYLTELFETGRWRRFHNEVDFLDNIQEARASLERWRAMAAGEFVPQVIRDTPQVAPVIAVAATADVDESPPDEQATEADIVHSGPHLVAVNDAPEIATRAFEPISHVGDVAKPAPLADWPMPVDLDAIRDRYPMLRAAM